MAVLNFQQLRKFVLQDDGVTWVDRAGPNHRNRVLALAVRPESGAAKAGIQVGDEVVRVAGVAVHQAIDVTRILATVPTYNNKTTYTLHREDYEFLKQNV